MKPFVLQLQQFFKFLNPETIAYDNGIYFSILFPF